MCPGTLFSEIAADGTQPPPVGMRAGIFAVIFKETIRDRPVALMSVAREFDACVLCQYEIPLCCSHSGL